MVFGDGIVSFSSSIIQYSYNSTGLFNPRVIATTINGCIDSINLNSINIIPQESTPLAQIFFQSPPLDVNFTISPSNIQNVT